MRKRCWTILLALAAPPLGADSEPIFSPRFYWQHGGFNVGVEDCTRRDRFHIYAGRKGTSQVDMFRITNVGCSAARVNSDSPDTANWYGGVGFGIPFHGCAEFVVVGVRTHGHSHSHRSTGMSDDPSTLRGNGPGGCAEDDDQEDGGGSSGDGDGSSRGDGGGSSGGGQGPDTDGSTAPGSRRTACGTRVTPYWQGPGGFVARPANGISAEVTITCGTSRWTDTLFARDDGLIVQLLRDERCLNTPGQVTFDGIEGGAWYWIMDGRNAAASPLVCADELGDGPVDPAIPGGVEPTASDHGTLLRHVSGLIGVVPHVAGGEGFHIGYWRGSGGIVGRPLNGRSARARVICGPTYATATYRAGEDGLIVERIDRSYCTDSNGNPRSGSIEVSGLADGGWYWVDGDGRAAVAPLLPPSMLMGAAPVNPGGLEVDDGEFGTLFDQASAKLIAIVPRIGRDE